MPLRLSSGTVHQAYHDTPHTADLRRGSPVETKRRASLAQYLPRIGMPNEGVLSEPAMRRAGRRQTRLGAHRKLAC